MNFIIRLYLGGTKQKTKKDRESSPVQPGVKSASRPQPAEYSPDDADDPVSRSPSPSLIADLSRLSDRQDDGPR